MAEFLWTFAVQEVLKKLLKLAAEQIGVAWGLDKELSNLKEWLLNAETILAGINRRKLCHDSVRLWVEDLQHLVYQADDLLDELVYEDLQQKIETKRVNKVRNFFSPSMNPFLFRCKMAKRMKAISETLYRHYCKASVLGLVGEESPETDNKNVLKQIRETTSVLNFEVIGREIEVSNIVKLVIDSSNEHRLSIIPIVGVGGVGKTTLAKMVFNHELIKGHFDKTIWVCVSEPFVIINILEGIFQSLTNTSSGLNYKETLVHRLQEEMEDKKYFLVLDDVWNEEAGLWGELRDCLNEIAGKFRNSIIVTTRSTEVATIMKTIPNHQDLKRLSEDECWSLFKKSANANGLLMNPELENIQKVVVKKIDGIPLVAKVLGGAAKFEGNYERWVTKVESIVRNISKDDKDFVLSTLKLSVDSLPLLSLKQCFAFCSNFPKDYEFDKESLIQMWIAQGFIQPQEGDNVTLEEDIGESYFNFLLSRSLFQDVSENNNGTVTNFKMHDLIHDVDVAGSISNQKLELDPCNWSEKDVRQLRTLIIDDDEAISYNDELEATIHIKLVDSVYLRVLVINFPFDNLPNSIGMMLHLRYLDIKFYIKRLPESITILYNLQTLKLRYRSDLPKNFRKLVRLRHLLCPIDAERQMPLHMSQLIHLQTLFAYMVGSEKGRKIEELGPLNNLRGSLRLLNLERVKSKEEAVAAKLMEKENLRQVSLEWNFSSSGPEEDYNNRNDSEVLEGLQPHKNLQTLSIDRFAGHILPNSVFVENLVEIALQECQKCERLPMLGQLPNLEELNIYSLGSVTSIGSEFYGNNSQRRVSFPKLRQLFLGGMQNLEQWEEVSNAIAFPHLESLRVADCFKLKSVNADHDFVSLQTLQISHCIELTKIPSKLECCSFIKISDCPNLRLNGHNMCNLKDIQIIEGMEEFDFSFLTHQSSVTRLYLSDSLKNATQLPQQLQHLTYLKSLTIEGFGIEALPEWLEKLASLEMLRVSFCENLKRLPSQQAMLRLTKLKHLTVCGSPLLLLGQDDTEGAKLSHLPINIIDQWNMR